MLHIILLEAVRANIATDLSNSKRTSSGIRRIEKGITEPVDESNSAVIELVKAGYTLEQSVEAVEKHRTLEASLEFLEKSVFDEDDEEVEVDLIPTSSSNQLTREESQPDGFKMDW